MMVRPRKNTTTVEKIDISDLIMIIWWVTNISYLSLTSLGQLNACNLIYCKSDERSNRIIDILDPHWTEYTL